MKLKIKQIAGFTFAVYIASSTVQAALITTTPWEQTEPFPGFYIYETTLNLSETVTFTATEDTQLKYFVLDEANTFVNTAEAERTLSLSGLSFSINGGALNPVTQWIDFAGTAVTGDVTVNDTLLSINPVALTAGDTVTLFAGTATSSSMNDFFQLPPSGDYSMFMATESGTLVGIGVVPEPATALSLLIGGGLLGLARRIKKCYGLC
jgi:hypothetical protein